MSVRTHFLTWRGRFRLLYSHQHRMSFDAVRSLLNRHLTPESPLYAEARAELRTLREMKKSTR